MDSSNRARDVQQIRMEHYRLHCVELWEDSPYKDAVIVAIHSALESLASAIGSGEQPTCMVCNSRRSNCVLLEFPLPSKASADITRLVA